MTLKNNSPTIFSLTSSQDDLSDTVRKIEIACRKQNLTFYPILSKFAYIDERTVGENSLTIQNYDGKGKDVTIDPQNTVVLARGGVINTQIGQALMILFENAGTFVVNERKVMELCANKLATSIELDKHKIPTPRTAFVSNVSSIDTALDQIGGKFPVIVKTLTGAEGVGVSIINTYESLKSVLQTLWKHDIEVLIQEYLEIKNDVRSLVLNGKVVAAAMRGKAPKDFRTNLAQGGQGGPYELSPAEIAIVEKAAKAFGCYYVGVDSVMSDGKPYIIEMNASPGSGNVYKNYFPDVKSENITGQALIDQLVKYIANKNNWLYNYRETGVVEKIEISGLGDFDAKLDTGNDSYNVLDADNITENGSELTFRVNGKKITKPIVSHVRIRTSTEHIQRRPVVELDVIFRNRTFKNVRFSITPRHNNTYPVLVGSKFLTLAKVSVNVSKKFTLPEELVAERTNLALNEVYSTYLQSVKKLNTTDHLSNKIYSLGTVQELVEMEDFLHESLEKQPKNAESLKNAIELCENRKKEFKTANYSQCTKETTMPIDQEFLKHLQETIENNPDSELADLAAELLNEAAKKSKEGKKPASKPASKDKSKKGLAQRLFPDGSQPKTRAAKRFLGYNSTRGDRRKHPEPAKAQQSGKTKGKVDGDLKGRFERYYGKEKSEGIRIAVARKIASGTQNLSGLAKGRGKGKWNRGKKKSDKK